MKNINLDEISLFLERFSNEDLVALTRNVHDEMAERGLDQDGQKIGYEAAQDNFKERWSQLEQY